MPRIREPVPAQEQQTGVHGVLAENLRVALKARTPAMLLDILADAPPVLLEPAHWNPLDRSHAVQLDQPVERHPAEDSRVRVMLRCAARLPDAVVRKLPVLTDVSPELAEH